MQSPHLQMRAGAGCQSASDPFHKESLPCTSALVRAAHCGNGDNTQGNLPVPATVSVWPWRPANGLLLLHLLLLLLSSWPRPAGAPAGTAGNPHRPSPTPSSPTPDHQTRHTPANQEEKKKSVWLKIRTSNGKSKTQDNKTRVKRRVSHGSLKSEPHQSTDFCQCRVTPELVETFKPSSENFSGIS